MMQSLNHLILEMRGTSLQNAVSTFAFTKCKIIEYTINNNTPRYYLIIVNLSTPTCCIKDFGGNIVINKRKTGLNCNLIIGI